MPYTYDYPRPALTVDVMLLGYDASRRLQVLLIQRAGDPFKGHWALPGGFVDEQEDPAAAAARELEEETGIHLQGLEQIGAFGAPGRDPRGHVVSIAWWALAFQQNLRPQAASDAKQTAWFSLSELPLLAFDHAQIMEAGRRQIFQQLHYRPLGLELLPDPFTSNDWMELNRPLLLSPESQTGFLETQFEHWKKVGIFFPVSEKDAAPDTRFQINWDGVSALFAENAGR